MLVAVLLALVPAAFILWPFITRARQDEFEYDEGSPQADLMRRWDAAVAGLSSTELDHGLGNMSDEDYTAVRRRLMSEAAAVMREMELTDDEEKRMLSDLSDQVRSVRSRVRPRPNDQLESGDQPGL